MSTSHLSLQETKADFLNVAHCWLYAILYYHQIYPITVFEQRTAYGILTPVPTSPKLKDYVAKLFKEIENSILALNYLEVQLVSNGQSVLSYRLLAGMMQSNYYNNRHQRQTELKYFIDNLIKSFRKQSQPLSNPAFNFYIQYREDGTEKAKNTLAEKWLLHNQDNNGDIQIVGSSLKLSDMNIIVSRNRLI